MTTEPSTKFVIEEYLQIVDQRLDMRRLRASSVNSSSTLLSCPISAMYNRVNPAKKNVLC